MASAGQQPSDPGTLLARVRRLVQRRRLVELDQRGKRSIGVNLKHAEGRELVLKLAETSHLTMENFAPGVVERLGVAYADVAARNPAMVYVSMSGWGRGGPSERWIGYGTHVQAASGANLAMPSASGNPSHMLIPYADPVSGLGAALGATAHLYAALATGRSTHIDVSELECMALTLLEPLLEAAAGQAPTLYPYRVVPSGQSFGVHPYGSDLAALPTPIHNLSEVLADASLSATWIEDRTAELRGTGVRIAAAPWTIDGYRPHGETGAPTLFADTRSVLHDLLDLDQSEIDRLVDVGAIACAGDQL